MSFLAYNLKETDQQVMAINVGQVKTDNSTPTDLNKLNNSFLIWQKHRDLVTKIIMFSLNVYSRNQGTTDGEKKIPSEWKYFFN